MSLARHFPSAYAYVEQLPDGLASFPDCVARREVFEHTRVTAAPLLEGVTVPDEVRRFLHGRLEGPWIPEVVAFVAYAAIADHLGPEGFRDWAYDDAAELYQRPVIRHLMKILSPTLVAIGAGQRWGTLRKGSILKSTPVLREGTRLNTGATLSFPTGLFPEALPHGLQAALRAALDVTRAKNLELELVRSDPGFVEYRASWDA